MFISNADKQYLIDQVKVLVRDMNAASAEITMLKGKVRALEGGFLVLREEAKQTKTKKPKKPLTEAQKAKNRDYQRAYQARRKAQKLTQGNTNVSA